VQDVAPFAPIKNKDTLWPITIKQHIEHSDWKCRQYADYILNAMRRFKSHLVELKMFTDA
jgi:hypothetical protein